jgi:hypothetical protein
MSSGRIFVILAVGLEIETALFRYGEMAHLRTAQSTGNGLMTSITIRVDGNGITELLIDWMISFSIFSVL